MHKRNLEKDDNHMLINEHNIYTSGPFQNPFKLADCKLSKLEIIIL